MKTPIIYLGLLALTLFCGCRKQKIPKAVAVSEDGSLALTLCSFNIRYQADADTGWKAWPNRVGRVVTAVRKINPDVMGIQEALHRQAADLRASLPDYDFYGIGRDDGRRAGEYSGIFWKRDRFEVDLQDRGTFWLSDTPEQAGSKNWGNQVVRVATWVRLTDRASSRSFYVFNTHWDHQNQYSRERAAILIAERIATRLHPQDALILLGDFNATENNPAVSYFRGNSVGLAGRMTELKSHPLSDPYQSIHPREQNRRTLHFWQGNRNGRIKVDHILVSAGAKVLGAEIYHADTRTTQPSDHYPVWVKVEWK